MDSLATAESTNLGTVKAAFDVSVNQGFMAGLEVLLAHAREDCEFRPYIASGHIIRGHDAIRAFYRSAVKAGTDMRMRPSSFHEDGDSVIVHGSMRVGRPSGGFSESQIRWTYEFEDGRLVRVAWGPRSAG
jgi:ketosteroid isomerase-like protein